MAHTKVTKTYSQNTGVANTFSYSGSFDVFKATEVVVTLDAVALTYTASTINESASPREYTVDVSAKTVHIGGADLSSGTIIIRPKTDMGAPTPRATYTPGASITSEDLNNNQKQLMRKAMEYDETKLDSTGGTMTGNLTMGEDSTIIFEGATDDAYETTLTVTDPTADRTITIPNVTGTVVTTGDTATVTATMMAANSVDSSELVDGSIDSSHISSNAITTGKITADAVTGAKIADDAIDSEHYTDGSIDTAHIGDSQVTTAKIADNAITSAKITNGNITEAKIAAGAVTVDKLGSDCVSEDKIADDAIRSEHLADNAVITARINDNAVTTAKIANDAITNSQIADNAINDENIAANQVVTSKIADANITTAKIADDAVTTAKIADDAVVTASIANGAINNAKLADASLSTTKYQDDTITTAKISDSQITTAKIASDAVTGAKIADDAINSEHYTDASIDTAHIADGQVTAVKVASNAVTTSKITDANVTTVKVADSNITLAKLAADLKQTSISDSDTQLPTSGAVVDYVRSQLEPFGGFEVIANRTSFPNTAPASGVVISITDASGIVFDSSSTPDTTAGNCTESDGTNVTIQAAPDSLQGKTIGAGVGMLVSYSGSGTNYTFHRLLAKDGDVEQLSQDINDFKARYRVGTKTADGDSSNDDGDLFFDTGTDKMYVYDGAYNSGGAWKEVTSAGDFKFLTIKDHDQAVGGSGPTFNGSNEEFDLFDGSSDASITSAAQLLVVLNGVLQKPNSGSFSGSEEGFYLNDTHGIKFCDPPASGSTLFVTQLGTALTINVPGDGTVTAAKIGSGAVTTAKLADANVTTAKLASDAITGAKIADDAVGSEHIEQLDANLSFADSVSASFGAGADLLINHDGTNNYIGTQNGNILITKVSGTEKMVQAIPDGAVELYHNNAKKLQTASHGVNFYDLADTSILTQFETSGGVCGFVTGDGSTILGFQDSQQHWTVKGVKDGAVSLYYDNEERIKTTNLGTQIYRSGEVFNFIERTGTGADNNWLGCHVFKGMNDASESTEFVKILSASVDVSDGSEDGKLLLQTMKAGTMTDSLHCESGYTRTPNNPLVMLSLTANQSVANTSTHNIDWAVGVNRGSHFDASNERFTAPIAGDYLCTLDVQFTQNIDQLHTGIQKNGGSLATHYDAWVNHGDDTRGDCRSVVVELAANDYITFHTYQADGDARNLEAYRTHASIKMVG